MKPRRQSPRVLLDTNVWRYLVDHDAVGALNARARRHGVLIQVAPSVVFEMLRTLDVGVRDRLVEAVTRPCWRRLMPEAYEECDELVKEIRRLRPEWLRTSPDVAGWQRQALDWARNRGGFWDRARNNTEWQAGLVRETGDEAVLDEARTGARLQRRTFEDASWRFEDLHLANLSGRSSQPLPGWGDHDYEPWRMRGAENFGRALLGEHPQQTYLDWVGSFVDPSVMGRDDGSWWRFWLGEIDKHAMPRCWLRWAFETVQATRKISDGTPCDSQFGAYLMLCDHFLTADRVLIDVVEKVRAASPVPLGRTWRVTAGEQAPADVQAILGEISHRPLGRP